MDGAQDLKKRFAAIARTAIRVEVLPFVYLILAKTPITGSNFGRHDLQVAVNQTFL
jgi:hypothetical protein